MAIARRVAGASLVWAAEVNPRVNTQVVLAVGVLTVRQVWRDSQVGTIGE